MKKKIASIFSILLAGIMLAGCSGKVSEHGLDPENPTEVTIWQYYAGAQAIAFDEVVAEFNSGVGKQKGIVVISESKGSIDDLTTALTESVNNRVGADDMPNIFQCYLDTAMELGDDTIFVNLDDYVTEEEKMEYIHNYIQEGCFGENNEWRLFPVAKSTEVMMVNKTDWTPFAEEMGHTEENLRTWEGLAEIAEDYYNWSGGKSFFGRDAFANYMVVGSMQLGTEIFQVNGGQVSLHFDRDVMKKLWDNYYIPYVKGYYKSVGAYRSDDIKLGEIISLVCSTTSAAYFPTEVTTDEKGTYPIEYMVLPVPNFEGTNSYAIQQGANMAVTKSDEQKEYASVVFLKWLTETDQNMQFSLESGYLPVKKDSNTREQFENFLGDTGAQLESIEIDTVFTALQEIEESTMYTSKGFENAYQARNVLTKTMYHLAKEDRTKVEKEIAEGENPEEALKTYTSEDHFENWYEDTRKQLEELCTK